MSLPMENELQSWSCQTSSEVIFSRKTKKQKEYHPPLAFNNNNVSETYSQKHLGVVLNKRLSFEDCLKMILNKVNKTIVLLHKLRNILPRSALITIEKSFIGFYLDYSDIMYDQGYNASFHQKLKREPLQFNACLAITGGIRDTSREKLYEELGLESLQLPCWFRILSCFYKLFNSEHLHYLFKLIPSRSSCYVTRNVHNIPFFKTRHFFKKLFLPVSYYWME